MKKLTLLSLLLTLFVTSFAQIRGNEIEVLVTLDREGWTYKCGEQAQFKVQVLKSGALLKNAVVDYKMGVEMYENIEKKDIALKDGTLALKGTMKTPGFYRLTVNTKVAGKEYEGMATAAFEPEKLQPQTDCPKDFDEFWDKAISDARRDVPLESTRRLLPEYCTDKVNVYEISYQTNRWDSRFYGILCVPTKPGKYPCMYKVPGAGCRAYYGDVWEAAKGCIVLEVGIHGVPVTNKDPFYKQLQNGPLNNYWTFQNNNKDEFYYKRVIIGAVRGIDYIASLPEWDGKNIGVLGSSQGGWLTIATTALDKRVSCYAPVHAALCDHTASLKNIACGWPHYFYYDKNSRDPKVIETVKYYDGVNFAKRITQPGWFSFGYNDDVVPPTTCWATYNIVNGPKEIHPYVKTKHFWYQEQYDEWIGWINKQMGVE